VKDTSQNFLYIGGTSQIAVLGSGSLAKLPMLVKYAEETEEYHFINLYGNLNYQSEEFGAIGLAGESIAYVSINYLGFGLVDAL